MDAACSCPYEWGGWCKHIVAVLLAHARAPETVRELPALEETLSGLDRDQLRGLLLKLAEYDPSLTSVIEGEISLSAPSTGSAVNAEAIRPRLHSGVSNMDHRDYDDYWSPGGDWPDYRERLLEYLRRSDSYYPSGPVDVFLHEDLIGDAIAAVEKSPVETLVARVAEAAVESHPGWVINVCRGKAGEIMGGGRSNHYEEAISWLEKARDAYLSSGREEEWLDYLDGLIDRHRRKYKLRPMLESLDGR